MLGWMASRVALFRHPFPPVALVALAGCVLLAGCGSSAATPGTSTTSGTPATARGHGTVSVAYAGSLVDVMEHAVGPAFQHSTGYTYQGKGAGSTALANQIASHLIAPDVFVSVSVAADKALMGSAHGNVVQWYAPFASTAMVIGYSPKSPYAAQFADAAAGKVPWYQVLEQPGVRLGRTDPKLDPKGINTILTMKLAEQYYKQPNLVAKTLGTDENSAQIFPEEDLVARLTGGQLDAGFFYLNEVKAAHIPYIALPAQINLSDPAYAATYAQASTTAGGKTTHGALILYTLTIPSTAKNETGAEAFVAYLVAGQGRQTLQNAGVTPIVPSVAGNAATVPASLRSILHA